MSSHDFDYKLKDPSGHAVASLQINGPTLTIHLFKQANDETGRKAALQEYKEFGNVLGMNPSIVNGTDVQVTSNTVPDALMQYVGMDLLRHHKISREEFDHFHDAVRNHEDHNQKLQISAESIAHHGQKLAQSGALYSPVANHEHNPAGENAGMGGNAITKTQRREV